MAANPKWKLTLYGSNTMTTAGVTPDAYAMRTIATSSLTTPASASIFIIKPEVKPEITAEQIEDVGGDAVSYAQRRGTFNVASFPFNYDATSATDLQDIDDLVTFADVATDYKYLYLRIDAGSRTYPATAGTVYPVTIRNWEESVNSEYGTRSLSVVFAHRHKS